MNKLCTLLLSLWVGFSSAQEYFPNNDDISAKSSPVTVIYNAHVVSKPGELLKDATIIIKDGKIDQIGSDLIIPNNANTFNAAGNYIYPSFIEPYGDLAMSKVQRMNYSSTPQYDEGRKGYYWNDHIRSEQNAMDYYDYDDKQAMELLSAGYGVVQTHLHDGIARGTGMIIALNNNGNDSQRILSKESGMFFSLQRSVQTRQSYPTSLTGTLALLRQTHYDARWYKNAQTTTTDLSLQAINEHADLNQYMEAGNKKNLLRIGKLSQMIDKKFIMIGGQDAYEMIDEIKKLNTTLIVPINFPDAYDVADPYQEWFVNLADMREWKQAPANPVMLERAGIDFMITSKELESPKELIEKLRQAIAYGLEENTALASITTRPAQLLNVQDQLGTLEKGKWANFIMTDKPLFDKGMKIYENWVQGEQHIINDRNKLDIDGTYTTMIASLPYKFEVSSNGSSVKVTAQDSTVLGSKIKFDGQWIQITTTDIDTTSSGFNRFMVQANKSKTWNGIAYLSDGSTTNFVAKNAMTEDTANTNNSNIKVNTDLPEIGPITYPNTAYGSAVKPKQEKILFKNATVWTNEDDGILENTDVLVDNGIIVKIGKGLKTKGAVIVDATGKHLTSGIVDEHSHIAIDNGVNEAGHNSTAEVSMAHVVDPEDINIYRNLAGGVTTAQLLHGSANPIGGQSAIIKMKWGYTADEMLFPNMPKFIKFALGENVKQSRYQNGVRFPQTRMGVEQVFEDYFTRARDYEKTKGTKNFRYDEEMEVLLEVINGERFVSCHSYVQSEINMLMKVAERHGFNINTFTHILEGYKVADKMREHGVGGSTFSDWWAYKYEVNDAIPYNAAIMHSQGVVTAINSDDAEMSRRLNQEAAKAVKYGDVSEEEAWKMVTLNPAKLLHLDHRTGSIKKGKDADLVLWSKNPLDVTAVAEKTLVDGIVFFDKERDLRLRESIKKERTKWVNEMIAAKNKGMKTQTPKQSTKTLYECNSLEW